MLDSIKLSDIERVIPGDVADKWEAAVETLMLSFVKHNVAIIKYPVYLIGEFNECMLDVANIDSPDAGGHDASPGTPAGLKVQQGKVIFEIRAGRKITSTFEAHLNLVGLLRFTANLPCISMRKLS